MWSRSRARSAGSRSSTTRSRPPAARRRCVPLDLKDYDGIDRLGAALQRALRQARRAGRQRRHARPALAARPCRAEGVGRRDGGQRHGELAPDPLARSAAAEVRRRARGVPHLGRGVDARCAYWGPYSVSKAAVELLARTYAAETATTKVRVNLFNPGPIRTRMRATAMPGEDPMTLDTPENVRREDRRLCLPSLHRDRHALQLPGQEIPDASTPPA